MVSETQLVNALQANCTVDDIVKLFRDDGRPKNDYIVTLSQVLTGVWQDFSHARNQVAELRQELEKCKATANQAVSPQEDVDKHNEATTQTSQGGKQSKSKVKSGFIDTLCPDFLQMVPCRHGSPDCCPKSHPNHCRDGKCYPHRQSDCKGWHVHIPWDAHLAAIKQKREEWKAKKDAKRAKAKHGAKQSTGPKQTNKAGNVGSRKQPETSRPQGKQTKKASKRVKKHYPPGHPKWAQERLSQLTQPAGLTMAQGPARYTAQEFYLALQRGGLLI